MTVRSEAEFGLGPVKCQVVRSRRQVDAQGSRGQCGIESQGLYEPVQGEQAVGQQEEMKQL